VIAVIAVIAVNEKDAKTGGVGSGSDFGRETKK
jgi:hypothetical protein